MMVRNAARHLLPDLRAEEFIPRYLSGYRDVRTLDLQNLDYYRALRCVAALVAGKEGQEIWNIPAMAKDLIHLIRDVTGIRIGIPGDYSALNPRRSVGPLKNDLIASPHSRSPNPSNTRNQECKTKSPPCITSMNLPEPVQ